MRWKQMTSSNLQQFTSGFINKRWYEVVSETWTKLKQAVTRETGAYFINVIMTAYHLHRAHFYIYPAINSWQKETTLFRCIPCPFCPKGGHVSFWKKGARAYNYNVFATSFE